MYLGVRMTNTVKRDTSTAATEPGAAGLRDELRLKDTIHSNLAQIRERIALACDRAGRNPDAVTLIAVTKTFPIEVVQAAFDVGLRHFGENRPQELKAKHEALPGITSGGDIHWHMIGHVQRNKAKDVVGIAERVHAIDSLRLAEELNRRAEAIGRIVPCMIQVNVSGEQSKFGLDPEQVIPFLETVVDMAHLNLDGFMTLATPVDDPEDVRHEFRLLRDIMASAREKDNRFAGLTQLSMGMSGDFDVAIEEGATHIRVGSALFGFRA